MTSKSERTPNMQTRPTCLSSLYYTTSLNQVKSRAGKLTCRSQIATRSKSCHGFARFS